MKEQDILRVKQEIEALGIPVRTLVVEWIRKAI